MDFRGSIISIVCTLHFFRTFCETISGLWFQHIADFQGSILCIPHLFPVFFGTISTILVSAFYGFPQVNTPHIFQQFCFAWHFHEADFGGTILCIISAFLAEIFCREIVEFNIFCGDLGLRIFVAKDLINGMICLCNSYFKCSR